MSWNDDLIRYFEDGIKKEKKDDIGVEIEHFIVRADTHEAVPYAGKGGVREVIIRLSEHYPGNTPLEGEDYFGFITPDFSITLEPAAQLEISIEKRSSIDDIRNVYSSFRKILDEILDGYAYEALSVGCQPVSKVADIKLIPKERYRLMNEHFKKTGDGGIEMMRGTSSVQVSVDYYSEEDFSRKIQAAHYFMPILKLLCDNAETFEGKLIRGHLKRTDIWSRTDPLRCGILPDIFSKDYRFADYAAFLGNMPLIFKEGENGNESTGFKTVSDIYDGQSLDTGSLRHVLSMAFPDVRLKNYLEIRFADSVPSEYIFAYCALIKGLLYSKEALDLVQEKIREENISAKDIEKAQHDLAVNGWNGTVYNEKVRPAARRMLRLSEKYLSDKEAKYLDVFRHVIDAGGIISIEHAKKEGRLTISDIIAQYRELIQNDMEKNRAGALAIAANMERTPLYFRDRITSKTLQIPRIYTKEDVARFERIVKITYSIFDKVIREYLKFEDYRALFPFSKQLEELILIPNGYDSLLPIARFDIFYHEDTGNFYFCEINTDGTSGMNEDRIQDELILDNPAHQIMRRRYDLRPFELFDSWVKTFLDLYETYENKVDKPNVAIVDFLDSGTLREFQEFARHFQRAGVNCEVCDIRNLEFRDGKLFSEAGNVIDAIYRRAVTTDIMDHIDELSPFINAVKQGACFVAGSFATQIIHHKWLFYVLHLDRTRQFLSEEENEFVKRHIPMTSPFVTGLYDINEVLKNKDDYILKPDDSYASNGVYAGVEFSKSEWEEKVRAAYDNGYICQRYCPQYSTENIDFAWGDGQWRSYISMAGLYVYNGRFAGVFARAAEGGGIIASHRNERTQPTYVVS